MADEVRIKPLFFKGVLFFLITGLVLLLFQTIVQSWMAPNAYGPDLYIILIVYLGLNAPLTTGVILVAALGFLKDAASAGLLGFNPVLFLIVFLMASRIRQKLDPSAPGYLFILVFLFSLWAGLLNWAALYFFNGYPLLLPDSFSNPAVSYLVSVLLTAFVGPFFFGLLDLLRPLVTDSSEQDL